MIPNVCYLFLGLHGRLLKGKGNGFKWAEEGGGRKGDHSYFFLTRARTRAPEYLSPSLSKACHSDYLFFLIIYDVDVICVSVLHLYNIVRK